MRWKTIISKRRVYDVGEERHVSKYAWFPTRIDHEGDTIWLESYCRVERFSPSHCNLHEQEYKKYKEGLSYNKNYIAGKWTCIRTKTKVGEFLKSI